VRQGALPLKGLNTMKFRDLSSGADLSLKIVYIKHFPEVLKLFPKKSLV
jgi:hypothetical protein